MLGTSPYSKIVSLISQISLCIVLESYLICPYDLMLDISIIGACIPFLNLQTNIDDWSERDLDGTFITSASVESSMRSVSATGWPPERWYSVDEMPTAWRLNRVDTSSSRITPPMPRWYLSSIKRKVIYDAHTYPIRKRRTCKQEPYKHLQHHAKPLRATSLHLITL